MIKKLWLTNLILLVVIALIEVLSTKASADTTKIYPAAGIVTEINEIEDYVVFTDFQGNEWSFYEVEDWMIGDLIAVIMNDMGTESIYDDQIIQVRYIGYIY